MFLSEWPEFPSAPCLAEKKRCQLASRCCWNCARPWHASELFLPGRAKDLSALQYKVIPDLNVFRPLMKHLVFREFHCACMFNIIPLVLFPLSTFSEFSKQTFQPKQLTGYDKTFFCWQCHWQLQLADHSIALPAYTANTPLLDRLVQMSPAKSAPLNSSNIPLLLPAPYSKP